MQVRVLPLRFRDHVRSLVCVWVNKRFVTRHPLISQCVQDIQMLGQRLDQLGGLTAVLKQLIFVLPSRMPRPLIGSLYLWEVLLFVARLQAPESVGECILYFLSHLWCVAVFHLPNEMVHENPSSRDIPWRLWQSRDINHELGRCGITSLCTLACALPLGRECGNLRRFRSAAVGWVILEEIVDLHPDQLLVQKR